MAGKPPRDNVECLKFLIPEQESDMRTKNGIEEHLASLENTLDEIDTRLVNRESAIVSLMLVECPKFHIEPTSVDVEKIKTYIKDK